MVSDAILKVLRRSFNGMPDTLDVAIGIMSEFRLVVLGKVVSVKIENGGKFASPAFQFTRSAT